MTVTTKNAKNGARLYYVDSKRVSRQIALEVAAQNRAGNPFVIEYDTEQTPFFEDAPSKKFVYTSRDTYTELDTRIDNYKGYTLYIGTHEIHTFYDKNSVKELLAQIEDAFINGEHGIKVTLDGTIGILPTDNNGYDESAFELLPTVDELNDADTGLPLADGEVEYMGDAQAILVATFIDGTGESKCFETAAAAIAFARDCEKNSLVKRGYVMGDDKHYGNEVIYEFKRVNATASEKSDVEIAEILTDILLKKISPWSPHMELTLQNGKKAISTPRTAIVKPNWHGEGFVFITPWDEIYARYDTPAQVAKVIGRLKACVVCKIPRFTYPTVDELTARHEHEVELRAAFGEDAQIDCGFKRLGDCIPAVIDAIL